MPIPCLLVLECPRTRPRGSLGGRLEPAFPHSTFRKIEETSLVHSEDWGCQWRLAGLASRLHPGAARLWSSRPLPPPAPLSPPAPGLALGFPPSQLSGRVG